jgi:prevent-host-death family protein
MGYDDFMSSSEERGLVTTEPIGNVLGVGETKARFSELIERVGHGERFLVARRGKPVLAIVPPDQAAPPGSRPSGLAAVAGALSEWTELPEILQEIYSSRRRARDRRVPELD